MIAHDCYLCESCGVGSFSDRCWICDGEARFTGFRYSHHARLDQLARVTALDMWGRSADEVAAIEAQLIPCPLCEGEGLVQNLDLRIWAECPHCWAAMYRVKALDEPFDPTVPPFGYDIAARVQCGMHRNRLRERPDLDEEGGRHG